MSSINRSNVGRLITTPYGEARVNPDGKILWAEWEVWCHSADLVEQGLWTSRPSTSRNRQRTEYFAIEVGGVRQRGATAAMAAAASGSETAGATGPSANEGS